MIAGLENLGEIDRRIGEAMVANGSLDGEALRRAERLCEERSERLPAMLSKLGLVSDRELAAGMARLFGLRHLSRTDLPREAVPVEGVSARFLRQVRILPLERRPDGLAIALSDPTDAYALNAFRLAAGAPSEVAVLEAAVIEAAIDRLYGGEAAAGGAAEVPAMADVLETEIERLRDQASDAPVIRLVSQIISAAVEARASDIHLEPFETELKLRYRIDGLLAEMDPPPLRLAPAIVSRVKIMAGLDIAERRRPQDGRIRIAVRGRTVDLRVSTVPVMHGESVVLRILDRAGVELDFEALGIPTRARAEIERVMARPEGVFLVTGPTGSGKTTTLYAALTRLNSPERKILTVEDPIEYQLLGINQVQVRPQIGLDFANVLRSLLRHDPDVMMVGEIRDGETAQIAVQAALTGHLVISTLHTNDAAGAVTRLIDMGVAPFLLSSTLSGIAAQRLVRRLCPACARSEPAPAPVVAEFGLPRGRGGEPPALFRPVGCETCHGRGYLGRTVLFEILAVTPDIRELIMASPDVDEVRRAAAEQGMRTMFRDGVDKVLAGITTLEEVLRTTRAD